MTDKEISDAITNGITAGMKPVLTRLDTLEASAKGATTASAGADETKIVQLITTALKPVTDKIAALENGNQSTIQASAKATVETIGIRAGRIAAQDKDTIAFWEGAIAANAKAADALAKMPVNPAFVQVVQGGGNGGGGTGSGAGEHVFVAKAKAYGDTHKITDAAEAQARFASTSEGRGLYQGYLDSIAPRN